MAIPSFKHRAGKIEIENKERKLKELNKNNIEEKTRTEEEHKKRPEILKSQGVIK